MDEYRVRYLDIKQMVKRELQDADSVYVNGILQNGLESGYKKSFWNYVKSSKQETFGISALKSSGNVFTPYSGNTFPQLPGTQCPKIKPLHISENDVFKLLDFCIKVTWTRQAYWQITAVSI